MVSIVTWMIACHRNSTTWIFGQNINHLAQSRLFTGQSAEAGLFLCSVLLHRRLESTTMSPTTHNLASHSGFINTDLEEIRVNWHPAKAHGATLVGTPDKIPDQLLITIELPEKRMHTCNIYFVFTRTKVCLASVLYLHLMSIQKHWNPIWNLSDHWSYE